MAPYNVLFVCTGNSARSIMAEALLNHRGGGRFKAFSAGSHPKGQVHPLALETLRRAHVPVEGARSKSWDEFAAPGAPAMDFVLTVCGNAANEACPRWPGGPTAAHWGVDDPAAVDGSPEDQSRAFERALRELDVRLQQLIDLPIESLDEAALGRKLADIGHARA